MQWCRRTRRFAGLLPLVLVICLHSWKVAIAEVGNDSTLTLELRPTNDTGLRYAAVKYFTIVIANQGTKPCEDVAVDLSLHPTSEVVRGDRDLQWRNGSKTAKWNVGVLAPGKTREKTVAVLPDKNGDYGITVQGKRGGRSVCSRTSSSPTPLLVEIMPTQRRPRVGENHIVELRVTNVRAAPVFNIQVRCLVPDVLRIVSGDGPVDHQIGPNNVTFVPLPKLEGRESIVYRVIVKGAKTSNARIRAEVNSLNDVEPIVECEEVQVRETVKGADR